MKRKILRVTGDDFGLTIGVSDGIIKSHLDGMLTHTSIMVNGQDFQRAVGLSNGIPTLGVGVHLNLTQGSPILRLNKVNTLINTSGHFFDLFSFIRNYLLGYISIKQVYDEWNAQLSKAIDAGIKLTHLDSHHHVHMLPGLNIKIKELAEYYSIPWIRISSEALSIRENEVELNLKKIIFILLSKFHGYSNKNHYFKGFSLHGKKNFKHLLKLLIKNLKYGTTELMVHPGIPDEQLELQDTYVSERLIELEAICDNDIMRLIEKENIILMGK